MTTETKESPSNENTAEQISADIKVLCDGVRETLKNIDAPEEVIEENLLALHPSCVPEPTEEASKGKETSSMLIG